MDESRNPNLALWQMMPKLLCFKDAKKFIYLFFCFWFGLLFCRLLWSGFGDLVLVMEWDSSYSMDNLYEQCESRFWGLVGVELSKEQRDVDNAKLYEVG